MEAEMGGWQREAESPIKVLKTTIVGGLLFLLPLVLVVLLLSHALRFAGKAVGPISEFLTLDKVFGPAAEESLAVLILVFISLAAGLIARTRFGRDIMRRTENSFLGGLPQYRLVKSVAEGFAQIENAENLKPVLVNIEEGWQIGYLLESLQTGWVVVFLPQAPTPMSGNVMYLPEGRVRPLAISMVETMSLVKHMGIGSSKALATADLALPKAI
ncbi:MAG TPA: DUF502 domain-containing protein [Pseudolabrys sp.]|nr:DUF502 domain-containing protein [Pseudolabrys sp.]